MARRKLVVEIIGESAGLERTFRRSSTAAHGFERSLERTSRGVLSASGAFRGLGRSVAFASGAFLGAAGIVTVAKEGIHELETLRLAQERVAQEFGSSAVIIEDWGKTAAESFALSEAEALKFAANIGQLIVNTGKAKNEAAGMTTELVTLAGRIATLRQLDPAAVMQKLQAAVSGRAVGLKQLGFLIDNAAIKEEALRSGLVKSAVDSGKVAAAETALSIARSKAADVVAQYGAGNVRAAQAQLTVKRATDALTKAQAGSVGTLSAQAKGLAVLNLVLKQAGFVTEQWGAAQDSTAVQSQKFHAHIEDLKASIGAALEPTVKRYLATANHWLASDANQAKVGQAVTDVVRALSIAMSAATAFIRPLYAGISAVAQSLGGWKTALELAAGAWLGFKVAAMGANAAIEVSSIAAAAGTAAAWRAALVATGWGAFAVAAGAAAAYIVTHWKQTAEFFRKFWIQWQIFADEAVLHVVEVFSHLPSRLGGWARGLKDQLKTDLGALDGMLADFAVRQHNRARAEAAKGPPGTAGKILGALDLVKESIANAQAQAQAALMSGGVLGAQAGTAGAGSVTKSWRDKWAKAYDQLQLTLSQKQLIPNLPGQLRALEQVEKAIRVQLGLHKDDLQLSQQLVEIQGQRADLEKQIAQTRLDQRKAAQFRQLGLTAGGDPVAPSLRELRGQLGRVDSAISGTFLDTKRTRTMISNIRKVLAGGLKGVGRDVRDAIHGILDDFNQQLKDNANDRTKFRHANTAAVLAGLGLSPDQVRAVRARLAQVGAGGTIPGGGAAFGLAGGITIGTVNVHGVQNARQFESDMARRARSRPKQRRGT